MQPRSNRFSASHHKINPSILQELLNHKSEPFHPDRNGPMIGQHTSDPSGNGPFTINFTSMNQITKPTKRNIQLPKWNPNQRCPVVPNAGKPWPNLVSQNLIIFQKHPQHLTKHFLLGGWVLEHQSSIGWANKKILTTIVMANICTLAGKKGENCKQHENCSVHSSWKHVFGVVFLVWPFWFKFRYRTS